MDDQWTEIADAIQSSDSEQVNEALDQIKQMDADECARLFDVGFDELRTIYAAATMATCDNRLFE